MKRALLRRFLNVMLVLSLLWIFVPAVPVSAAEVIEITPDTGEIGDRITISGSGFFESEPANRGVNICFGKDNPGSTINYDTDTYEIVKIDALDSDGTFSTSFTVPDKLTDGTDDEDVSSGTYYIYLTYYYSDFDPPSNGTGILEIITFTVIGGSITLSPTSGEVGSTVSIDGSSFANNDTLYITFDNTQVGTTASDSLGAFTNATITVPESARGNHIIKVDDGVNTDVKTFSTTSSMTISPTSGFAGDTVTLTGKGYKASSAININFDGSLITTTPASCPAHGSTVRKLSSFSGIVTIL